MADFDNIAVVVSGANGFIGSRLVPSLRSQQANVIELNRSELNALPSVQDEVGEELERLNPRDVFFVHLAGMSNITECEKEPEKAYRSNVELTQKALSLCAALKINKFIFASTGQLYGVTDNNEAATEESALNPQSVYAKTKMEAEQVILGEAKRLGLSAAIMRLSNVYGPGGNPNTVIGRIIGQIQSKGEISLIEYSSKRDFIYIDDVIEGICRIYPALEEGKAFVLNMSYGESFPIMAVANAACEVLQLPQDCIKPPSEKFPKITASALRNDFLREKTNWKPATSIKEGLARILVEEH